MNRALLPTICMILGTACGGESGHVGETTSALDQLNGAGLNDDLWSYSVSYQASGAWYPLCGVDAQGAPVGALAMAGLWDQRQGVSGATGGGSWSSSSGAFTFACRNAAIGKCAVAGYKPW